MILVGVIERADGSFTIVDAKKSEHSCKTPDELHACLRSLTSGGERAETRGATADDIERHDMDAVVDQVGKGIGDYIGVKYGETLGDVTTRTVHKSARGLVGFMRKVSRK